MKSQGEITTLLRQCKYRDWIFFLGLETGYSSKPALYLQLRFPAADTTTGAVLEQRGRKWRISIHMSDTEIVNTAWFAVKTAIEHEAREEFLYRGRAIYNSHLSVEKLWETSEHVDLRAVQGDRS